MIGILKKFEPLERNEITVTLKVPMDQLQEVVNLFRKEVHIQEVQPDIQPDKKELLSAILSSLEAIKGKVETL